MEKHYGFNFHIHNDILNLYLFGLFKEKPQQYDHAKEGKYTAKDSIHITETEFLCFFLDDMGNCGKCSPPNISTCKYADYKRNSSQQSCIR